MALLLFSNWKPTINISILHLHYLLPLLALHLLIFENDDGNIENEDTFLCTAPDTCEFGERLISYSIGMDSIREAAIGLNQFFGN